MFVCLFVAALVVSNSSSTLNQLRVKLKFTHSEFAGDRRAIASGTGSHWQVASEHTATGSASGTAALAPDERQVSL